jgi:hypothetical protein
MDAISSKRDHGSVDQWILNSSKRDSSVAKRDNGYFYSSVGKSDFLALLLEKKNQHTNSMAQATPKSRAIVTNNFNRNASGKATNSIVEFNSGIISAAAAKAIRNTMTREWIMDLFWKMDSRKGRP